MQTVGELLESTKHPVRSVKPTASAFEAIQLMDKHKINTLLVLDRKKLVGTVSERDCARNVILKDKSAKRTQVQEIMQSEVVCASPGQSIEGLLKLMADKRLRYLPVVDGAKLVGVISIADVTRATLSGEDSLIEQLTKFITGS